jgi:hypothetical protein
MKRFEHECACATCRDHPYSATAKEHLAINRILATLNEKSRRRFVGLLAQQWGRGGVVRLSEITGLSRPTIRRGRAEIQKAEGSTEQGRVRRAGAGRLRVEKNSRVF